MHWQAFGRTDRGRVRELNEDAYLVRPDLGVFAVADGLGGHAAGELASRIAVDCIERGMGDVAPELPAAERGARLRDAVRAASREILTHAARDPESAGMGTTVTAVAFSTAEPACAFAHVGDSRAYLLSPDGRLRQLTTDHTWVQQQIDAGYLTPRQARSHPYANVLYRALGAEFDVAVDTFRVELAPGDLLLLCSDGLTGMLSDDELRAILDPAGDLEALAQGLIDAANRRGGLDNTTVVLIRAADSNP